MTKQPTSKSNRFLVSEQVKSILHNQGLSKVFNYTDYKYFKTRCAKAFNTAQAIAEMFIQERAAESDLMEYEF